MLQLAGYSVVDDSDFKAPSIEILNLTHDLLLFNREIVWLLELSSCGNDVWEVQHYVVDIDVAMQNVPLVELIQSVSNLP